MKKKIYKYWVWVVMVILIALLVYLAGSFTWFYYNKSQGKIFFEGSFYTAEKFEETFGVWPEHTRPIAETRRTPEETYTLFRDALLSDDIDSALKYIVEDERGNYRNVFGDAEKLVNYKTIPEEIIPEVGEEIGNFTSYKYRENGKVFYLEFKKNKNGDWYIESI